ncbi:MAG TPA: hypothetical protein VGG14_17150 [Candidatus Sulfotelmatobacter sp.]|jgi:glycosyltransferase involved in cell wall biosynthesis
MPPITALLHTSNDARRLGRALETLLPCADVLVVDHHSFDQTPRIAASYGARVILTDDHHAARYLDVAEHDWILCLDPSESMTEGLQAALFEWTLLLGNALPISSSFCIPVRRQVGEIWHTRRALETRLIPRTWSRWNGNFPADDPSSIPLDGELLRLDLP